VLLMRLSDGYSVFWLPEQTLVQTAFDGAYPSSDVLQAMLGVDKVLMGHERLMVEWLHLVGARTLHGQRTEGASFDVMRFAMRSGFIWDPNWVLDWISKCRRTKRPEEVAMIEYATRISAMSQVELMKRLSARASEVSLLGMFRHLTFLCGCRGTFRSFHCPFAN
jgi:hypothetical protein